jgi:hypothetical protein
MRIPAWTAALAFLAGFGLSKSQEPRASRHVSEPDLGWEGNEQVPAARWKTLVGSSALPATSIPRRSSTTS